MLLYLAALLLTLPGQWIASAIAAICIHELCHAGASLILGYPIWRISVGFSGVKMETAPMEPAHELICALAGPLGALLTLPFARWIPGVCVCAAIHTLYNLLPIYPSDGGRALLCAARLLFPEKVAFAISIAVQWIVLILMAGAGLWMSFGLKWGAAPWILSAWIIGKSVFEK